MDASVRGLQTSPRYIKAGAFYAPLKHISAECWEYLAQGDVSRVLGAKTCYFTCKISLTRESSASSVSTDDGGSLGIRT